MIIDENHLQYVTLFCGGNKRGRGVGGGERESGREEPEPPVGKFPLRSRHASRGSQLLLGPVTLTDEGVLLPRRKGRGWQSESSAVRAAHK